MALTLGDFNAGVFGNDKRLGPKPGFYAELIAFDEIFTGSVSHGQHQMSGVRLEDFKKCHFYPPITFQHNHHGPRQLVRRTKRE